MGEFLCIVRVDWVAHISLPLVPLLALLLVVRQCLGSREVHNFVATLKFVSRYVLLDRLHHLSAVFVSCLLLPCSGFVLTLKLCSGLEQLMALQQNHLASVWLFRVPQPVTLPKIVSQAAHPLETMLTRIARSTFFPRAARPSLLSHFLPPGLPP